MNFMMFLRAADALVALADAARSFKGPPPPGEPGSRPPRPDKPADTPLAEAARAVPSAQVEARLTGVIVAALKEAFNRDRARLDLERQQLDEQRRRAEEALQAELRRQAAERELARLRLLAATALIGWLVSVLVLGLRAAEATMAGRVALGIGWVLLLAALGTSFIAQGRINPADDSVKTPGGAATATVWLIVAGLAITAISLLI